MDIWFWDRQARSYPARGGGGAVLAGVQPPCWLALQHHHQPFLSLTLFLRVSLGQNRTSIECLLRLLHCHHQHQPLQISNYLSSIYCQLQRALAISGSCLGRKKRKKKSLAFLVITSKQLISKKGRKKKRKKKKKKKKNWTFSPAVT